MALFGFQLVVTMVMTSVLSKLNKSFSVARWLLCNTGLVYFLHPTDDELRIYAGIVTEKGKKNKVNKNNKNDDGNGIFLVPKSLNINLEKTYVIEDQVIQLHFYSEYQWLVDFSLSAAVVYFLTEVYLIMFSVRDDVNLSMLWCALVVGFSLKILFSLTRLYFKGAEAEGEKTIVILSFFAYLLIALGVLIIDESKLELGLDMAYTSFNQSAAAFLRTQGLNSEGPASKLTFKIFLAFICALIGAFFTFPGLRLGKMHFDSFKYSSDSRILKFVLHLSFLAPIFLALLWIKPISRYYLTEYIWSGYQSPIMSPSTFDILRVVFIICIVVIRLIVMPVYLQSYLHMAHERVELQKKESGKITNKEFQKKVARVFYYLCVVSLQYVTPMMICLFLAFMFKTLGGLEWKYALGGGWNLEKCSNLEDKSTESSVIMDSIVNVESFSEATHIFSVGVAELKKVFTTEFYRGVLGFSTWWCIFAWFLSGTFGVAYQSYFMQSY